jgi:hypothetical protein
LQFIRIERTGDLVVGTGESRRSLFGELSIGLTARAARPATATASVPRIRRR